MDSNRADRAEASDWPGVHLLTKDRLLRGRLSEEGGYYVIEYRLGSVRIPKDELVASFRSIEELYRHKVDEIADRDPDEHLRLAKWCLSQNLTAQARQHLQSTLRLLPGQPEARRMLASMEANVERKQREVASRDRDRDRNLDSNVVGASLANPEMAVRSSDSVIEADRTDARARAIQEARQRYGNARGAPVIFDLSPTAAFSRARDFANVVHPVLQRRCGGCHNERHDGDYQLIQVLTARDRTQQTILFNMDATLRYVNPNDPARSELVYKVLGPHSSKNRPIFEGRNDRDFQVLNQWLGSLRTKPNAAVASPASRSPEPSTGFRPPEAPAEERFASDRLDPTQEPTVARRSATGEPSESNSAGEIGEVLSHPDVNARMKSLNAAPREFNYDAIQKPGSFLKGSRSGALPPPPPPLEPDPKPDSSLKDDDVLPRLPSGEEEISKAGDVEPKGEKPLFGPTAQTKKTPFDQYLPPPKPTTAKKDAKPKVNLSNGVIDGFLKGRGS